MKTTVHIEVALDAFKTTQLYRAKCTHTVGTSAHLFDLSSSVVKAFQELVLNLTIYSTSSFTATGVHFHGCCSAGIWLIHFVPLSEYLAIWLIIYTQFCVFQKTEAETKTKTKTVPGPKWPLRSYYKCIIEAIYKPLSVIHFNFSIFCHQIDKLL